MILRTVRVNLIDTDTEDIISVSASEQTCYGN